ncbi:MAG: hypothetical protein AB7U24_07120 [Sulfurimonadaceae bacterium]
MKTLIIAAILSALAYSSVGAIMESAETQKSHKEQIDAALALK